MLVFLLILMLEWVRVFTIDFTTIYLQWQSITFQDYSLEIHQVSSNKSSLNIANLQFNMAYIVAICNNNDSDSESTFDKYITKYCNDCIVCFTTPTESCKCCLYFISVLVQQK